MPITTNHFKQNEIAGLREVANWEDYPNQTPDDVCIEMDSVSSLLEKYSPPMDLTDIVAPTGNFSSLIRFSKNTKKREHAKPMDMMK